MKIDPKLCLFIVMAMAMTIISVSIPWIYRFIYIELGSGEQFVCVIQGLTLSLVSALVSVTLWFKVTMTMEEGDR